jgi:hypothetical protein
VAAVDRLLHEKNCSTGCESRKELLGALKDEVPSQMGENDDWTVGDHIAPG